MNCQKFRHPLNLPCQLKCSYYIDRPEYKNCIICYMKEKGKDNLSVADIAELFSMPPLEVDKALKRGVDDMRVSKLDGAIAEGNELEFVEDSGVCVVCSTKTVGNKNVVGARETKLCYCSQKCRDIIPPKLVLIMQRLGVDLRTVLVAGARTFPGKILCELYGVTPKQLKLLYRNNFGLTIHRLADTLNGDSDNELSEVTPSFVPLPERVQRKAATMEVSFEEDVELFLRCF